MFRCLNAKMLLVKMFRCLNVKMTERGVSIYLALMIMFISLTIGLEISLVIVSQMKMIRGIGDSVIAFYAADTGIERVLYEDETCYQAGCGLLPWNCIDPVNCNEGRLTGSFSDTLLNTATYETNFYDKAVITKSIGTYNKTKRAIEAKRALWRVFVTSQTYTGNLGGLAGADAKCQTLADAAGLRGTFKAWLSDGTTSAASRFTHRELPYALVDDTIVAYGWDDLTDGSLLHPINLDENGNLVEETVWTNTTESGGIWGPVNHCINWTSEAPGEFGGIGTGVATDEKWTVYIYTFDGTLDEGWPCWDTDNPQGLYCFEQ